MTILKIKAVNCLDIPRTHPLPSVFGSYARLDCVEPDKKHKLGLKMLNQEEGVEESMRVVYWKRAAATWFSACIFRMLAKMFDLKMLNFYSH
jgi:hypothetical protein